MNAVFLRACVCVSLVWDLGRKKKWEGGENYVGRSVIIVFFTTFLTVVD